MDSDEESDKYLLGFIMANIVGLQHHSGSIHGRALVGLVREPHNPHDPNAIQVLNTHSLPVGYIERAAAAALSPLIDAHLVTVEAIVPNARKKSHRVPCQIHVFARLQNFNAVKHSVTNSGLKLITESNPAFTLSDAVAVKETKAQNESMSVDTVFNLVDRSLADSTYNRVIEPLEPTRSIIKSELLQHQKEGLAWLLHREKSHDLPPFWEEKNGNFVNILTDYQTRERPHPLRGGIFADDMGLGKTLTLLSLMAFDKKSQMGISVTKKRSKVESERTLGVRTNATLVVCPPSVMSTWIAELEEHTVLGGLKTYMYYGERRTKNVEELKKYDLVLTTYSTLSSEQLVLEMPAKKMLWRRIILDEAHAIKNFNAQQSAAVCKLNGECRWAVTGTPIQSGCIDLFSIMVFLRFEPFSVRSYWRDLVQRSLDQGTDKGLLRLQVLMDAIALRRTKDVTLAGLPPKTTEVCYVELSLEERELYDQMKEQTKTLLSSFGHEDSLVPQYSAVLSRILRLRQICTDLKLCKDQSLLITNIEDVSNNPELLQTLLGQLQDGEDFDCPICLSPPMDIVITCCAHIFCRGCILRTLQNNNPCCPLCRHPLSESDLFSAPPESSKADGNDLYSSSKTGLSSKVSTLIKLLTQSRDQHPAAKSVVYSQFRKLLLLLEEPLNAAGFKTLRLDGTMNAKHRAKVIEQFQVQGRDGPTVLLASLRASSAGINLTSASRLYFMEPWWNHAVEEQAMDRVHRIGQKEAVKVVRLIAQNSIEEKMLMLQEKKKQLSRKSSGTGLKGMGMNDIRFLLD
ncbi:putative SWI/SNF-related matrix-associated actin-dependent regulator of chromatin subfamily A member 3-like 1 [Cajanus cajan]|uniref:putative SWI/SNF-related matrix-associated actin-dependent regulator of chromatin subfamily A member 3-like 1 n=1 Tax=Cajanus cajan TaxID=3821 RepID=UPI00098D90BF|nr:putative SWI/SNF-related matrix-associated actin-dependent regulator of chromatin subfamily A member 3-like 1 [Cajanus cajan]